MHDAKLVEIFQAVSAKTLDKRLPWQETDEEEIFEAVLEQFTLRLSRHEGHHYLSLLNSEGKVIQGINADTLISGGLTGSNYAARQSLEKLFAAARSSALGIDDSLNALLNALSK